MDDGTELVWRQALKARGKDWVVAEMHKRPGRPEDPLYDVVFESPYPTRAFCMQWCAEEENRIVRISWHTYAVAFALALVIVCIFKAVQSWNAAEEALSYQQQQEGVMAASPAAAGGAANLTNTIPSAGTSSTDTSATATAPSGTPSRPQLPSVCAYITYDTPQCRTQR